MDLSPFSLRSWQFHGFGAKQYLAQAIDRTIAEAQRYNITHLEFGVSLRHPRDYTGQPTPPCGNSVLCGLSFRDFPKLAKHDVLHDGPVTLTKADREADLAYVRELFYKVKAAGLGVIVWHHLRRDLPDELAQEYPESASGDPVFLQQWEEKTLAEFFELMPEVDMLMVTSMTETPGVHNLPDGDPADRLESVFCAIDRACRAAGKTLAIRDWGSVGKARSPTGHLFHEAMARLPQDIPIYIKNVVCDFVTNAEVPHPNLAAYPNRPLIVEFDVYGEYFGRTDIPYVDPQHFCHRLDALYTLKPYGVSGRICFECDRSGRHYPTIFESPNAANAVVFARWSADAAEQRDTSQWLDITAPARRWQTYYWQWLTERYGLDAAPLLARLFDRTPQIIHGIFGGLWTGYWHPFDVLDHTTLPWPPIPLEQRNSMAWSDNDFDWALGWLTAGTPTEHIGWCQLVSHKREALRLAVLCQQELGTDGPPRLAPDDMADLKLLFEQLVMVCRGDVLTGEILLTKNGSARARRTMDLADSQALAKHADEIRHEAITAFGKDFFGQFPLRMKAWADWARSPDQAGQQNPASRDGR